MVLVDTNVLLDVFQDDPVWGDWSQAQLDATGVRDTLCINPVIYAELSIAFARIEQLEGTLEEGELVLQAIPREALFLAGKIFVRYRRQRGAVRTGVLLDFFIGAHAAVGGMPLLTRDAARYASYFPTVELISPR